MERYRRFWEGSFDRLDDYLREMKMKASDKKKEKKNARKR